MAARRHSGDREESEKWLDSKERKKEGPKKQEKSPPSSPSLLKVVGCQCILVSSSFFLYSYQNFISRFRNNFRYQNPKRLNGGCVHELIHSFDIHASVQFFLEKPKLALFSQNEGRLYSCVVDVYDAFLRERAV